MSPLPDPTRPDGTKIAVASAHLREARLLLLGWSRDAFRGSDNVTDDVEDVQIMLHYADMIEQLRAKLEVRASIIGR